MDPVQIFISYARDDDAVPPESSGVKGFVTFLHGQLEYELQKLGQPRPRFWRDTKRIQRADQFKPLIEEALAGSGILVVVLSRNWLSSPFCLWELDCFSKRWRSEGEASVRRRIVVVSKHAVSPERRPHLLQGQESYKFFTVEQDSLPGEEYEFYDRGQILDPVYTDRVRELGRYLWTRAIELGATSGISPELQTYGGQGGARRSTRSTGRTVFLAKPAADMRAAYHRVSEELQGHGYSVVPSSEEDIPHDVTAAEFVDEALARAEISIHLLGEKLGYAPEEGDPIVKLQLARAALRCQANPPPAPSFQRILWAPRVLDTAVHDASGGRDPFAVLKKFGQQLPTDTIESDSLSKFVEFIFQRLERTAPAVPTPLDENNGAQVYLYYHKDDAAFATAVQAVLHQRDIDVFTPAMQGDSAEIEALHRKHLATCNAVVLCWASAPEVWAKARAFELKNWRELGRTERFAYRSLVAGPPPNDRKAVLVKFPPRSEIDITLDLTACDQPSPELLDPLFTGAQPRAS